MGVWIETNCMPPRFPPLSVTPCMGVWIETFNFLVKRIFEKSHPVWVCGLKHVFKLGIPSNGMSHPVWVCGLKPYI